MALDLVPELLEAGRRLAADAGVVIDWVHGDAENLPFEDESFDIVLSTFGCIFAPRHQATAKELARALRPGAQLALTSWTPEGTMGAFFRTIGSYLPPPSPLAEAPALWGSEAHVEDLFEGTGVELTFERDLLASAPFESGDTGVDFLTTKFGPLMLAREHTEATGRWHELRAELSGFLERNEPAEYLIVLGRKTDALPRAP